jgi:hypothetical protein
MAKLAELEAECAVVTSVEEAALALTSWGVIEAEALGAFRKAAGGACAPKAAH